ncbi:unnamed protein product, partial [Meganyctiphanes norvegica]
VNITEKLAKDQATTKKCISMQEKMFIEFYDMGEYVTEGLINVTSTVKSSIIEEINTKIINISAMINASDSILLDYVKLNNKDIKNLQETTVEEIQTTINNFKGSAEKSLEEIKK